MEITLEQVEQLRSKANVSYALAKQALEYSGGNLLDALIYLEELGSIPRAEGAYYSTKPERAAPRPAAPKVTAAPQYVYHPKGGKPAKGLGWFFHRVRCWLLDNELEIWRKNEPITAIPVLILVLLFIAAPWVTIPLLILGLFLGFRYRFSGPDLERDSINSVMGSVADTAADVGRQVVDELRNQHEKHSKDDDKQE